MRGPTFRAATDHVPRAGEFVTRVRNGPRSSAQAGRLSGAPDPKSRLARGLQPNPLNGLVNEIANGSGRALASPTNVTDAAQVQRLVDAVVDRFGRIDVMLNNAGLTQHSPLEPRKIADWDQTIDVNIEGVLYGIAAALLHMQR